MANNLLIAVFLFSGKTSNSKDICGDDKHKEDGDPWNVEAQAAFLGPNLWDKTLPYDTDLKVHQVSEFFFLYRFFFIYHNLSPKIRRETLLVKCQIKMFKEAVFAKF